MRSNIGADSEQAFTRVTRFQGNTLKVQAPQVRVEPPRNTIARTFFNVYLPFFGISEDGSLILGLNSGSSKPNCHASWEETTVT